MTYSKKLVGELEKMSKNNRKKVYKKPAKQGNNSTFGKAMITIIVLGIVFLLFYNYGYPMLKKTIKRAAAQKTMDVITENVEKIAGNNPQVAEVLESLTEEDKEAVAEIIENHLDAESVGEVMGYVSEGDEEALIKYASENLTQEEISDLLELYGKYAY